MSSRRSGAINRWREADLLQTLDIGVRQRRKKRSFRPIHGELLYGGHWMMLPTNAARHLYLVLAALDPIVSPELMAEVMEHESIEERREKYAVSYGTLERLSGLSRRMLAETLNVLTLPMDSSYPPYFERGGNSPSWYAREPLAFDWKADHLNASESVAKSKASHWPEVAQRMRRDTIARRLRKTHA